MSDADRIARQDALYADEPWAKLALKAGFRPYDTEASARSAFGFCAKQIATVTAERDRLRILLAANLGFAHGAAEAALEELGGMGAAMALAERFAELKGPTP